MEFPTVMRYANLSKRSWMFDLCNVRMFFNLADSTLERSFWKLEEAPKPDK